MTGNRLSVIDVHNMMGIANVIAQCFLFFASLHPIAVNASSNTPKSSNLSIQTIQQITDDISCWKQAYANGISARDRPFVTLAFAQSLDGNIAIYLDDSLSQSSSNFPISGEESLVMTHALRSIHDAILIGGNTLSIDNPRLSNRLWGSRDDPMHQPRPVVLDTHLRHIIKLGDSRRAQNLIVCCCQEAMDLYTGDRMGITLLPVPLDKQGRIDLALLLKKLREEFGIESLMVEGGSSILSAFGAKSIVDCLCVTVSPKLLGKRGVPSKVASTSVARYTLNRSRWFQLGSDCVLLSQWLMR